MKLLVAFAPYIFLGVIAVVALTVTPIRSALETISVGPPFPATNTGFGVTEEAVEAYAAFTPLTHPGAFLLLSALFGYLMFKHRDWYPEGTSAGGVLGGGKRRSPRDDERNSPDADERGDESFGRNHRACAGPQCCGGKHRLSCVRELHRHARIADHVIQYGLERPFWPPPGYRAEGVPVTLVLGAQAAGAAVGNAISPADALLGATTVGDPSLVGGVLRRAIPWAIATGLLISSATVGLCPASTFRSRSRMT
jgi:lactate permease